MDDAAVRRILEDVQAGRVDPIRAAGLLRAEGAAGAGDEGATFDTGDARVDLDRRGRCGFPEVVFCQGKTAETVVRVFEVQRERGQTPFGTRVAAEQAAAVVRRFPEALHNPLARTIRLPDASGAAPVGRVVVVTAGTSDRPVAEEALETLAWMGVGTDLMVDVGVAGPRRLLAETDRLAEADAVVVAAGMEGALPSVVGGWTACPVVAVPTSVGYGANFAGLSALLSMLNSCAANVTVVNIDAGFKAGFVAGLISRGRHACA